MTIALQDLQLGHLRVVYPGNSRYRLDPKITVWPLQEIAARWQYPS